MFSVDHKYNSIEGMDTGEEIISYCRESLKDNPDEGKFNMLICIGLNRSVCG